MFIFWLHFFAIFNDNAIAPSEQNTKVRSKTLNTLRDQRRERHDSSSDLEENIIALRCVDLASGTVINILVRLMVLLCLPDVELLSDLNTRAKFAVLIAQKEALVGLVSYNWVFSADGLI